MVRRNNQRTIEQARKFVWGSFGKLPDREILTEQQRREAIDAARGKRKEAS
jgi:hypothetical protein